MSDPRRLEVPGQRLAEVRPARVEDAEGIVSMEAELARDGRGMVIGVDQVRAVEEERVRIDDAYRRMSAGEASLLAVATLDGSVAALGELKQLRPQRCQHVGVLSLGVHPRAQRLGLGRAIMTYLVDHARACGLTRLELYTREDNTRARALYESLGFVTEGVRRGFVKLEDGTLVDDLIMVRWLE